MSQSPITVTYSLEEVLKRLEGKIDELKEKIDNLAKDVNELKVGQAEVKVKVEGLEKDVDELKGSQKAQIWALIGILGTVVLGTIIRYVMTTLV